MAHPILIGTSGYVYKSWKGWLYPEDLPQKQWLTYFAERFPTVEINATFYRHFPLSVFASWAARTPDNFQFFIKGSKMITHRKKLKEIEPFLEQFFASAVGLGSKLQGVLWQFPASFTCTDERAGLLENLLRQLPKNMCQVIELRDQSWFNAQTYELLTRSDASLVVNETQAFATTDAFFGTIAYIRFHGPTSLYSSSYTDEQLAEWAGKIKNFATERPVYAFFNNDVSGYAIENAKKLMELVKS